VSFPFSGLRFTWLNLFSAIVAGSLAIVSLIICIQIEAATAATTDEIAQIDADHARLRAWQIEAPILAGRADAAHRSLSLDCQRLSDLNGTLVSIGAALNAHSDKVLAHADFKDPQGAEIANRSTRNTLGMEDTSGAAALTHATDPTKPGALASPVPTPSSVTSVLASPPSDLTEIKKELKLRGSYPAVITAFASLQALALPISLSPPAITRSQASGASNVELSTTMTLALPKPSMCDEISLHASDVRNDIPMRRP